MACSRYNLFQDSQVRNEPDLCFFLARRMRHRSQLQARQQVQHRQFLHPRRRRRCMLGSGQPRRQIQVQRWQLRDLPEVLARITERIIGVARRARRPGRVEVLDHTCRTRVRDRASVATVGIRHRVQRRAVHAAVAPRQEAIPWTLHVVRRF